MGAFVNDNYRKIVFWPLLAICLALALIVNLFLGIDVVYTHIFYIPIILAGLWYGRKAIYVALFLGIVHIAINLVVTPSAVLDSLLRAIIFLLVALVVGTLSEEKDRLNKSLNDSNRSLLDSNQKLSEIIEFYPDATLIIDNDGKVVAWNQAIEDLTGVKAKDMIGKGNYEYSLPFYGERKPMLIGMPGEKPEYATAGYSDVVSRHNIIEASVDKVNIRGKDMVLWLSATRLFGNDGKPIGAIESIRDVTKSTRTEQKLKESEEKFRSLVESSYDAIFIADSDHHITYANHFAAESQGCAQADLIGKNVSVLFKGGFSDVQKRYLDMAFESAKPISYEDKALLFNKESWVHTQLVPLKTLHDEVDAVVGVSRDITGRKSMEGMMLLKNNELEIVNSIISTINSSRNIDSMLDGTLERLLGLMDMDEAAMYLYEGDSSTELKLVSHMVRGKQEHMPAPVQVIGAGYRVPNKFYMRTNGQEQCNDIFVGATASACVPIFLREKVIGILSFYSEGEKNIKVTPELLTGIVSQMAIAIENNRLFRRMSHTSEYLANIINESPGCDADGR